uniref:C-type natriuretic peptide n=1 Tax=Squalus acanthias TaxID=7797 RepID=ANFC_SQUAC|nr:RecName: Full=C-type natriuretic peptide; Flags: Precursor [Squalus acanthias]CAA42608.1 prepro atrial natriuretic factor [Squalus acanthias]prf//1803178A C-type natriuretic peptide [Squalus acanthias]
MSGHTSFYCGLLLLLLIQVQARPRADDSLQVLSRLLEDEYGHFNSEELNNEAQEISPAASLPDLNTDQSDLELPWDRESREIGGRSFRQEALLARLLQDLSNNPLRFKGRSKKGPSRSCFGLKLDRIGAMSGLGC